ncbi:hypothetical protein A265_10012 (plasmid) [Zymomonas mobilis subsp. mobilis str. CP4 = NRRL B-14023]|uniref:Uncharacterized protein n=1 Tax=Zymomonas mobilis subsp. mobilis (strain ATCC 31821 / ZM4 / CP4) TaxID=264203 RepID=A0A806CIL7_ZYMMO|nr:BrnT family toxin [Zymomonas mobilis]ADC33817.1 hypothetical protein ZZM4_0041 [Zymomonas mobilis subsp. mobilis ZM4 = ATCC 31821]AHB11038.1 hypothetical protein ZCP4_1774 [Zymomonas mobilis subsp. mobilis str. CP4 = NRRL B-14023]AHJ73295.1 hypothetical protein A265_10012 [Zymomonas mobilis subsp. mobilis str. CP4 = NRRL B-14023]
MGLDPAKDATNLEKHGLSLAFGNKIFGYDNHLILSSIRQEDGEERYKVISLHPNMVGSQGCSSLKFGIPKIRAANRCFLIW